MTPVLQKFLELERKKTEVKRYFDELKEATEAVANELGVGSFFQDPSDGTVFKIVIPEGRFVSFDKIGYIRTRRENEDRGDLSLTAAEEAGFQLPDSIKKKKK